MSFTKTQLNGYEAGRRYEKRLVFVKMESFGKERRIVMADESGTELLWSTTAGTSVYRNFRLDEVYRFTVDCILAVEREGLPSIHITRLAFAKR